MPPGSKLQKKNGNKSILDLHETIFHEIFQFLDHNTIFLRLRGVCRTIKTYADSFLQLCGVSMILGDQDQSSYLLQVYTLKHNVIAIGIHSIKPYPTSEEDKMINTFRGMFNEKIVSGTFMKSKEGLWVQEAFEKRLCIPKKRVYWPYELMLQTLYEYDPKENEWITTISNSYFPYNQHFRITWYPIGNVCLILAWNDRTSNKYMMSSSPACFTDPLIISHTSHYETLYDVDLKQSFYYGSFYKEQLRSHLKIPHEIYTLQNFDIVRVGVNKLMIVGGKNSLGSNFWLWQGELAHDGLVIEWTRKYNLEGLRNFNSGYRVCFKLGDNLYIIGVDKKSVVQEDAEGQHYSGGKLYCDRYDLKEEEYKKNVHKVPSTFFACPESLLINQNDTFVLITTDVCQKSTLIFTADKGFEDPPKMIFSKGISFNPLHHPFYQTYHPIKIF